MNTFQISATIQAYSYDELPEDYRELVDIAKEMTKAAYSPYSRFSVGAALRLADGTIVRGCNQENAAYPSGLCAERTAMFAASANHPGKAMVSIAIVGGFDQRVATTPCSPCGACRQVMAEYQTLYGKPMRIIMFGTEKTWVFDRVDDILPFIFDSFNEK